MKELSEYTDIEKIEWFDKMYGKAHEQFDFIKNTGSYHENSKQFVWEAVIGLLGEDIWTEWNNYDASYIDLFSLENKYMEKFDRSSMKGYTKEDWGKLTLNEKIDLLTERLNGNEP